jgi:UDP:flavonoid glycosyltransferase YjiC (YdhE family)
VNLKTETPKSIDIKKAVGEVLENNIYKQNVLKLGEEFSDYNSKELTAWYVQQLVASKKTVITTNEVDEVVY